MRVDLSEVCVVLPARLGSTRLPGKMLADLCGKPLIVRTWERVVAAGFSSIYVATDDDGIEDAVRSAGGRVVRTGDAPNGTVRVAEAVRNAAIEAPIILNVQGDEPLVEAETLRAVATALGPTHGGAFGVATAAADLPAEEAANPARVKVVCGSGGRALYFSRSPIPSGGPFRVHVGIYAFLRNVLDVQARAPSHPLEQAERLEQLRWLAAGVPIRVVDVGAPAPAVDTPEDLDRVRKIFAAGGHPAPGAG